MYTIPKKNTTSSVVICIRNTSDATTALSVNPHSVNTAKAVSSASWERHTETGTSNAR